MTDESKKVFSITLQISHFVMSAISSIVGAGIAMLTFLALSAPNIGAVDCKADQITIIRYRYGEVEKVCVPANMVDKVKATLKPQLRKKGGP